MKKVNPAMLVDPLYEPFDMSVDYDLYKELSNLYLGLLSTFELRKAAWQMQSGLLFEAYPGCTHTRRAHAIGSWILGWHSLQDIKVLASNSGSGESILLKDWLKSKKKGGDFTKEYLLSLLLHDVGHGPFSHALESNPFLNMNHEEIGRSLICNTESVDGINYYVLLKYLLTIYKIKKIPDNTDEYKTLYSKAKKEARLIHDLLEADENVKTDVIGIILKGGSEDPKLYTLHQLVDSEVDMDRIDHFLRDSYYSGIKFADYRVKGILQNLVVIPKNTKEYRKISKKIQKEVIQKKINNWTSPPSYLMIKEEGIEQAEYLLTAREFIFDRVLLHPRNLMLIGALNMGVRLIARYQPCLKTILPFLTDQILLQMFRENKFANTTIEGYEKFLRGELSAEEFSSNKTFLCDNLEEVEEVYEKIEDFNSRLPLSPRVIAFSNLKRNGRNSNWWKNVISEKNYLPLGMSDDEEELFKWLQKKEENRSNKVIIWYTEDLDLEKNVGLPKNFLEREVNE